MSGDPIIRAFEPSDLAAVFAINDAEVPAVGEETADALARIAAASSFALVCEVDGVIAGFTFVLPPGADYASLNYAWFSARYDDFIYLDRVAISPAYQRRGLGHALYAEVERLAAERQPTATDFALEVNLKPRNDQSLAFHAGLGFGEVGQQESHDGKIVSMMTKPLPG